MSDIKDIPIQELGSENSGENCAANEPFALRILDSSMSPEFEVDHIIIIDPSITPKSGDFVVYESTVYPGCTEEDCIPVLEAESKLSAGQDFYLSLIHI